MKGSISSQELSVAIDIGTAKICVLVGRLLTSESIEIVGIGKAHSEGMARGVVVDVACAVRSIKKAVQEAELMAGVSINTAAIGVSGGHIQSLISQGMIPVKRDHIRPFDVAHVLNAAKAIPIPQGQQVLHVLPQFFTIDAENRVKDPVGMYGVRLEAQVNIITGAVASVQNLIRCCQLAGVTVDDIVFEPLASASAVLTEDERELGVAVLDIGGGTSDFALYQGGTLRFATVLPFGGQRFTQDLAICLRTSIEEAERIKMLYGITPGYSRDAIEIDTPYVDGNQVYAQDIADILAARGYELCSLIKKELTQSSLEEFMTTGLVLTGGGSLLKGMHDIARETFKVPVRIGKPRLVAMYKESLDSPMYATSYGLLLHALKRSQGSGLEHMSGPLISRVFCRMKSWIHDFF